MHSTIGQAALERANISSEIPDKSSDISDAMRLVRFAAEPRQVGDSIKAAITRASRRLGWSASRTRDIWYGNARRIDVPEMDALRALERERDAGAEAADRQRYIEQLAVLRTRLQMRDPEFHRADCVAIDWLLNEIIGGISDALKQPDMFIEKPKPATQEAFSLE